MASQVATYTLDNQTSVSFEVGQLAGCGYAGTGTVVDGWNGVEPTVSGAKEILDSARDKRPEKAAVKSRVKGSGTENSLVAKASAEDSASAS